jgi:hypothetical protein
MQGQFIEQLLAVSLLLKTLTKFSNYLSLAKWERYLFQCRHKFFGRFWALCCFELFYVLLSFLGLCSVLVRLGGGVHLFVWLDF